MRSLRPSPEPRPTVPNTAPATVLIVDDDPDIRESLALVIGDQGYAVATASNGEKVFEYLEAETAVPALILLDLQMPATNGWQVIAGLRANPEWALIPVVVTSGSHTRPVLGATDSLPKPFGLSDLFRVLRTHCGAPAPLRTKVLATRGTD